MDDNDDMIYDIFSKFFRCSIVFAKQHFKACIEVIGVVVGASIQFNSIQFNSIQFNSIQFFKFEVGLYPAISFFSPPSPVKRNRESCGARCPPKYRAL